MPKVTEELMQEEILFQDRSQKQLLNEKGSIVARTLLAQNVEYGKPDLSDISAQSLYKEEGNRKIDV